jgi:hypothetical protein
MGNAFLQKSGLSRRAAAIVVVLFALTAVAAMAVVLGGVQRQPGNAQARTTSAGEPSASQLSVGPLKLIKGSRTVDGILVGYPHTTEGAVSAAVEYLSQVLSNLDPTRARAVARVIADSSFGDAASYFAQGPTNVRRSLGLPTTGPVPAGASVTLGPAAYQLRSSAVDSAIVILLAYYTSTTPDGRVNSTVGAYPVELHWDVDDWKVLKPSVSRNADYAALVAQPGSTEAAARGWLGLAP